MVLRCFQCDGSHHILSCKSVSQRLKNYILKQQGKLEAFREIIKSNQNVKLKRQSNGRGAGKSLPAPQHVRSKSNLNFHRHTSPPTPKRKVQASNSSSFQNSNSAKMRSKDDVSNRFSLVSPINNKFKRHKHNPTPSPEPFVSSPKDKKSSCDFSEEKGWQTVKSRSEKKFEKEKSFIHAFQLCIDSENDFDVGSDGIITCGNAGKVRVDKVVKFVMKKLIGKKLKGSYTFAVEFVESDPEFGIFDVAVSQRFHQFLIQSKFYENAPKPLIDDYCHR